VTIVHREQSFRSNANHDRKAKANQRLNLCLNSQITEILGEQKRYGCKDKNLETNAESENADQWCFC